MSTIYIYIYIIFLPPSCGVYVILNVNSDAIHRTSPLQPNPCIISLGIGYRLVWNVPSSANGDLLLLYFQAWYIANSVVPLNGTRIVTLMHHSANVSFTSSTRLTGRKQYEFSTTRYPGVAPSNFDSNRFHTPFKAVFCPHAIALEPWQATWNTVFGFPFTCPALSHYALLSRV